MHIFTVSAGSPSIELPSDYDYALGVRSIKIFASNSETFVLLPPVGGKIYFGDNIVTGQSAVKPIEDIGQNFFVELMPVFNSPSDIFAEFAIMNSSVPLHIVG